MYQWNEWKTEPRYAMQDFNTDNQCVSPTMELEYELKIDPVVNKRCHRYGSVKWGRISEFIGNPFVGQPSGVLVSFFG